MADCKRGEGTDCTAFETKARKVLAMKTIAVVGMSPKEDRPSFRVGKYLLDHGYDVIPVNPTGGEILGRKVYKALTDIEKPVDVVDVFRRSLETPDIAKEAVAIGAKALWLQEEVTNEEAEKIACAAGLLVVMDTCLKKMHTKFIGE
jgi:uncharacterized protein